MFEFDHRMGIDTGDILTRVVGLLEASVGSTSEVNELDDLGAAVVSLTRAADLLQAALAEVVSLAERRGVHRRDGYTSMTAFLAHRARIRTGRAKRLVGDARCLETMPETRRRIADGRLSADEVRVLIDAAEAHPDQFSDAEATLCDAVETTHFVADARRAVDYWRQSVADASDFAHRYERRTLTGTETLDGMFELFARFDAATGRALMDRIVAETAPPSEHDHRTHPQRRADSFTELVLSDGDRPSKPLVLAHVSAARLAGDGSGVAETDDTVLGRTDVARIVCDASVSRLVIDPESHPLDIGRATRTVPEPMRRAVIARDRHCRFPGCRRPTRWCDAHHVVHWSDGGPTSVDNLVLLCRHHHTLVHTDFQLTGSGRDARFTRPDGTHLPNSPPFTP